MKILVIGRGVPAEKSFSRGMFEFEQAKALVGYGHQVIYAAVDLRSIRRKRKLGIEHYSRDGISVFSIAVPVGAIPAAVKDPIGKWALKRLYKEIEIKAGRPDIVHAHFLDMGVLAAALCIRENLPLVITEHSSAINQKSIPAVTARRARYAYSNAKKVVAVSTALAANIKRPTGIEATVVPNIVNMPEVKAELHEAKNSFRFISAGNLVEGKGFDILIKAFAAAEKIRPEIRLNIMGGGPEEAALKNLVKSFGLEKKISFFGPYNRTQFAEELGKSDAFILASRGETFGVVYIEAMACGLPVIATRCGGPEDIVNEANGLFADVDDVQGLKNAMLQLVKNIGSYNKEIISEVTRNIYSSRRVAERMTEIFDQAMEDNYA